ncbi:Flp pilus assembly pilin Flp [Bradyrhizobium japonicum]|jgi:pilus assembly protein Flp/PilA|uniref:Flp pilus assembly pilin Flp n=4 Tax=Bradyrhizobium TaxID=374 RepID=A0ABV4F6M5_BRAEL|nr:Flp pilus assembly pilin Flp [Bradyrhizobium elkanii]MCP1733105.1 Flp pilus assembly pilin Flp [Bradyrhizobium elkanii]MCP1750687.1 Flp pilus assembly pilin Flp [Bradyrhizobium elkanii]MCP1967854.1 Flp pilus assembly pilin Flp [Bradyrhizobium elkanii]MCP1976461.1 Flp pilus assembly pilin Flp [Bradyrhizobium elkanii]
MGSSQAGSAVFVKISSRIQSNIARIERFPVQTTLDVAVLVRWRNWEHPSFQGITTKGRAAMKAFIVKFLRNESGATAIEYGLIATGIAIAIIAAVNGVGTALSGTFNSISGSLK